MLSRKEKLMAILCIRDNTAIKRKQKVDYRFIGLIHTATFSKKSTFSISKQTKLGKSCLEFTLNRGN